MRTRCTNSAALPVFGPKTGKWESKMIPPESLDAREKCALHEPFATDFEGPGYREKYPP